MASLNVIRAKFRPREPEPQKTAMEEAQHVLKTLQERALKQQQLEDLTRQKDIYEGKLVLIPGQSVAVRSGSWGSRPERRADVPEMFMEPLTIVFNSKRGMRPGQRLEVNGQLFEIRRAIHAIDGEHEYEAVRIE